MKHKPEQYINSGFYDGDDTFIEAHKEKLVKCRKPHECMGCGGTIKPGETALCETGFMDGEPMSCYTCIPCLDDWLDLCIGEIDAEEYSNREARHFENSAVSDARATDEGGGEDD